MFVDGFTTIHTLLSFAAILSGLLVLVDLIGGRVPFFITGVFLLTAIATSATGFGFAFNGLLPSHIVGAIALLVLALALHARFVGQLAGSWRWIYAASMVASVYFLVFVGVAQSFNKVGFLHELAPTQSEPPFAIAQLVVLVIFVALGIVAARAYRPGPVSFAQPA